ncbi:hypothetical protein RR42_s3450 [Cupriavidus basilensis]|uniref:Uncharacterized protein n=1 Tax=Cupriavidus basilensis TaxID=68895 RepID=A0A0C4YX34_9BURK|nr:hypothetical protein RR42_s3450 [Cupriavidus basilensis]
MGHASRRCRGTARAFWTAGPHGCRESGFGRLAGPPTLPQALAPRESGMGARGPRPPACGAVRYGGAPGVGEPLPPRYSGPSPCGGRARPPRAPMRTPNS